MISDPVCVLFNVPGVFSTHIYEEMCVAHCFSKEIVCHTDIIQSFQNKFSIESIQRLRETTRYSWYGQRLVVLPRACTSLEYLQRRTRKDTN